MFPFDRSAVLQTLKNSERKLEGFYGFLHRQEDLRHSYDKFRFAGDVAEPTFAEVYLDVKLLIRDILPKDRNLER